MKVDRMVAVMIVGILLFSPIACRKKGPAERFGEKVDEAVEDVDDAAEDAADDIEDKFD